MQRPLEGFLIVLVMGLTALVAITFRRHQRQQALHLVEIHASENRLQSVFRVAPTGIGMVIDRILAKANNRMCEMTGYSEQELLGQRARMLYSNDEDFEYVGREKYEQIRDHGTGTVETRWKCKDGHVIDVLLSSTPMDLDDLSQGVTFTALDITDRKRAEIALENRIVALTQPLDSVEPIRFEDLFSLDEIQTIQDGFAKATGVASIITTVDGTPITKPSNFCRLCSDIIRKTEKGCINCYTSDAALGQYHPDGPIIHPCMSSGLWDAGASISVGGKHIANWLVGQVRDETQTEEAMRDYARKIGADETDFMDAFHEVPAMSHEQFEHVAQSLFTLANQLSTTAYQNVQQARFITERKQAEADMESLAKFPAENPYPVLRIRSDGELLHANPAAKILLNTHNELVDNQVHERWATCVTQALAEENNLRQEFQYDDATYAIHFTPIMDEGYVNVYGIDISDRKQAEVALHSERDRISDILESTNAGTWDWNIQTGELIINDRCAEITGRTLDELGPVNAKTWISMVHPDDLPDATAAQEQIFSGELDYYDTTFRQAHKDGGWVWVNARGKMMEWTEDGKPLRMSGIHLNITERKQAEEELQKSEAQYKGLFNNLSAGVVVHAPDTSIIQTNLRACTLLGLSEEQMLGHIAMDPDWHFLREDGTPLPQDEFPVNRILSTKQSLHNIVLGVFRPETNDLVWLLVNGFLVYDEQHEMKQVNISFVDITARKQAEEAVREKEENLRVTLQSIGDAVIATDTQGAITQMNPVAETLTGWPLDEARGKPLTDVFHIIHAQTREFAANPVVKVLATGEIVGLANHTALIARDGTEYQIADSGAPIRNAAGKTIGVVLVFRDVTEEYAIQEQLRQSQKMDAVGQLAGGIAHDFNNLLQAILGYGEMALGETKENTSIREFVEQMIKAGTHAKTLTSQLLAFSRRQVLEMEALNLNEIISELMKILRRLLGEHIALDILGGHDLGIIRADRGQLGQILTNLCVNARDAMPEGGTITIETENIRIDEDYCKIHAWATPGRFVLLSVTDTGCGMNEKTLAHAFDPFFSTKEVGKGTGLGLSTVYGLIKQHSGTINAYSEIDKGTTFKIYLPIIERAAAAVGDKIEGPVPPGTETILLAEDDEMVRDVCKSILKQAGYTVLTAYDGEEALRVFEEHEAEIDMVILDVVMPNLGGKQVYAQIHEKFPHMRFLFASGYSLNAIHTNFVLHKGLSLIQKPYQRSQLLRKVREVLEKDPNTE